MKKTIKAILGSITAIAFVLVMSLSVLTFQNISGNASTDIPNSTEQGSGSNVSDGSGNENPSNPNPTPDPTPDVNKNKFEGIYEYYYLPTFLDIYYNDHDELINYFDTKDLNGVYNAVKPLGYDNFVKDCATKDSNYYALYVNGNTVETLTVNNKTYSHIDYIEKFTFETVDGKIVTSLGDKYKIEFDDETNTPTIYRQFFYQNEDGEDVYTPLYIKYNLKSIADSVDVLEGKEYQYLTNSGCIVSTSTEQFDMDSKKDALANLLGIELDETKDIAEILEAGLNANTYLVSEDGTRLTLKGNNSFSISKANENNEFIWNNAKAIIKLHEINLSTGIETIVFSIDIDESTIFMFSLTNKI